MLAGGSLDPVTVKPGMKCDNSTIERCRYIHKGNVEQSLKRFHLELPQPKSTNHSQQVPVNTHVRPRFHPNLQLQRIQQTVRVNRRLRIVLEVNTNPSSSTQIARLEEDLKRRTTGSRDITPYSINSERIAEPAIRQPFCL